MRSSNCCLASVRSFFVRIQFRARLRQRGWVAFRSRFELSRSPCSASTFCFAIKPSPAVTSVRTIDKMRRTRAMELKIQDGSRQTNAIGRWSLPRADSSASKRGSFSMASRISRFFGQIACFPGLHARSCAFRQGPRIAGWRTPPGPEGSNGSLTCSVVALWRTLPFSRSRCRGRTLPAPLFAGRSAYAAVNSPASRIFSRWLGRSVVA